MRFITSKPLKPSIKFAPLIIKRKHKRTKNDEKILLSIRVFKKGISIFKILIGKKNMVPNNKKIIICNLIEGLILIFKSSRKPTRNIE